MIKNLARKIFKTNSQLPLRGWKQGQLSIPQVEKLSDSQLAELNSLLDWRCFVVDSLGRRFGKPAKSRKRGVPQIVPDRRLALLEERISLKDKHILEVGCFEGVHTSGLCEKAQRVTAIDSRIDNVIKTIVRTHFFGFHPQVFAFDLETLDEKNCSQLKCDVLHHIGVLYHLCDPVKQLALTKNYVTTAVFLDTHYATPEMAKESYLTESGTFKYHFYKEGGYSDVFSGMKDHAKWLLLEDIEQLLKNAGFINIEIIEKRDERNGPRVLLLAKK